MFLITKTVTFDAAHHLPDLPPTHRCSRPHGHTYSATLQLRAPTVDGRGFVKDYGELHAWKDYIVEQFDHHDLNTRVAFAPTAELLAQHLYEVACQYYGSIVSRVTVCETASTTATYTTGGPS